jgi:hypothetical protein
MMRGGEIRPHPQESPAVASIYRSYIAGEGYRAIAGRMMAQGVCYHADKPEWNKHMVKRILENSKYTGADGYPALITDADFTAAQDVRDGKTAGCRTAPDWMGAVKRMALCAECGAEMLKSTSVRDGYRWWHCGSENCGAVTRLTDEGMSQSLTALLNRVIARPELLTDCRQTEPADMSGLTRMQNELAHELGKPDWNEDCATAFIYAIAAEKYSILGAQSRREHEFAALAERIANTSSQTTVDKQLLSAVSEAALIGKSGIALRLKGGDVITEEGSKQP